MRKYSIVFLLSLGLTSVFAQTESYTADKGNGYAKLKILSDGDGTNNNNIITISAYGYGGSSNLNFRNGNWGGGYYFRIGASGGTFNQVRIIHGGGGSNGYQTGYGILDVYGTGDAIGTRISGASDSYFLNGNIGIGTDSPSAELDVFGNIHIENGLLQVNRTYEDWGNVFNLKTKDNNHFGDFRFEAEHTDSNSTRTLLFMDGDKGSVGIGTEETGTHELAVEGSIGAREIKVEANGWSDFVFEKNYNLRSLEEVEQHIEEKGHLPEIPSEAEVTENGINLGEMNVKLLQKIEELTLYLIEQNKEIESLKIEISNMKNE